MKTKTFDALEMKRKGQQALLTKLGAMAPEQQTQFWRQQNEELREWREKLRAQCAQPETPPA
jgi:uncharacterized coiled-coil protein SlyX